MRVSAIAPIKRVMGTAPRLATTARTGVASASRSEPMSWAIGPSGASPVPRPTRRPRRRSPHHPAVASSSCGCGSGAPQMHRQLGDGAVAPDCRHRHLRLERRAVLLPRPLHVLLPRYTRFLGAGLHLGHLSHFRGPAQTSWRSINSSWARERFGLRSRKAEKLSWIFYG